MMVSGKVAPNLWHIKKIAAVTTYGGTRFRTILMGDSPRKAFKRTLRALVHPLARSKYLALYDMNRATEAGCARFLAKVKRVMQAF